MTFNEALELCQQAARHSPYPLDAYDWVDRTYAKADALAKEGTISRAAEMQVQIELCKIAARLYDEPGCGDFETFPP